MRQELAALLWWFSHVAVEVDTIGIHIERLLSAEAGAEEGDSQAATLFASRRDHSLEQACGFNDTSMHPVWEAYAKFHREGRAALEHGKPLNGRPVKALIWHCRSGEECRGNGDQIRGLSTALYLAIATSRVLLLEWSRNGAEITDLFSTWGIDWRLPVGLDCQSETELTWWAVKAPKKPAEALGNVGEQCVFFKSNRSPEDLGPSTGLTDVVQLWRGCAFNFLFREAKPLANLLSSRVGVSSRRNLRSTEVPFVGLHLRFGDSTWGRHCYMMEPGKKTVEAALGCAVKMGQTLFTPDEEWNILLVTDNIEMKKAAMNRTWVSPVMDRLGERLHAVPRVFTTVDGDGRVTEPAHTNFIKDSGDSKEVQALVLDAWADQLGLARAQGVVATFGGFAVASAEVGLMPKSALWHFDAATGACGVHGGADAIRQSSSRNGGRGAAHLC
jgi:hypothetical protein